MLSRTIVICLLVLGAAVLLVPRAASDEGEAAESAATSFAPTAQSAAPQSRRSGATVLPRAPDGHYYAEVTVGGRRARMLVDTGASIVALTGEDARTLGLQWHPADLKVIGYGAGGAVRGIPATLAEVELDGHRVQDVQAAIIPEGLPISLLGQSFMGEIGRVEIGNGEMVLHSR